jgi:hypothetical protein
MKRVAALLLSFAVAVASAGAWTPPASPTKEDVLRISREAVEDARWGRHADALAKHLWFHDHALAIDDSLRGVRLSFELSRWMALARTYPPALEAFEAKRRAAGERLTQAASPEIARAAFRDFAAMNDYRSRDAETVAAYEALGKRWPTLAADLWLSARDALIREKAHALAVRWLDVDRELDWIAELLAYDRRRPAWGGLLGRASGEDFHARSFETIIALLAINGRMAEARRVAERARRDLRVDDLSRRIDRALAGTVPPAPPRS